MKSIQSPPVGFSRALELKDEHKLLYRVCRLMWLCMKQKWCVTCRIRETDWLQLDSDICHGKSGCSDVGKAHTYCL